jgi:hypothetical protein
MDHALPKLFQDLNKEEQYITHLFFEKECCNTDIEARSENHPIAR